MALGEAREGTSGDLIASIAGRAPLRNLHSQVQWQLGVSIVGGTYPEGSILPSDSELLQRFDVSRTVLREALKTLAAKGMIEARARIGAHVRVDQSRGVCTSRSGISPDCCRRIGQSVHGFN